MERLSKIMATCFFLIPGFTGLFPSLGRAFQPRGYAEEVLYLGRRIKPNTAGPIQRRV